MSRRKRLPHGLGSFFSFAALAAGLFSPAAFGPVLNESQKLLASDGAFGDVFGISISVAGDVAIVGAPQDDDNGNSSGSAYVYRWTGSTWAAEQKLLASDGAADDFFGGSVSVSGDIAVVGAYRDQDNGRDSGSAYVYRWNGSTWAAEQKLLASDGEAGDFFGGSVFISGDVVVVGARGDDDNGFDSGSGYVFRWNGSAWAAEQKLLASDGAANDGFGGSVSISGNVAVVGALGDDDNGTNAGSAYVFRWNGAGWAEQQKLLALDGALNNQFGGAVSISGDVVVVGARFDDDNGSGSGSAYVLRWNGTAWATEQKLLGWDGAVNDEFGWAVTVSGDVVTIGARRDDDNGSDSGSAYVFRWNGSVWAAEQKLVASDGAADDQFGSSVSISGEVAVVGAWGDDNNSTNSGSAYAFGLSRTEQPALVDARATGANNGTSWADAYNSLQVALADASARNTDGDPSNDVSQIWIASGTYMPDGGYRPPGGTHVPGTGDRNATFPLLNGAALYGGYAGLGAPDPNLRDFNLYETILSGDLGGNDTPVPCTQDSPDCDGRLGGLCGDDGSCIISDHNSENSYHVVSGSRINATAYIDGFSITSGNANESSPEGGGMVNRNGSNPTVTNCTFSGNSARIGGGGLWNNGSNPTVTHCTFRGNTTGTGGGTGGGGAMYNYNFSNPMVNNCTFTRNSSGAGGGIANNYFSSPMVTNCLFSRNVGGGMANGSSSPRVADCTFSRNVAAGGGAMSNASSYPTVTNCIFVDNSASFDGGGMYNFGSAPMVTNCIFDGNSAESAGGGIFNIQSSAIVTNCVFSGNSAYFGGGMLNSSSYPKVTQCTFSENAAEFGGAMSNGTSFPTVTNCKFNGNRANQDGGGMLNGGSSIPAVTNCVFIANSAGSEGGALYNLDNSSPMMRNCTVVRNSAGFGGGIYNDFSYTTVINCILWQNEDAGGVDESAQIHTFSGIPTVNYSIVQGGWSGAGGVGNIDADPMFLDADFRLHACSPAIDSGNNTDVPSGTNTDLDGNPRFVDGDGNSVATVDMGAFEFQGLSICGVVCGNGVIDSGEECDDGPDNSDSRPDACRTDCTLPRCGDGVVDAGEVCEQASDAACPGQCRPDCTCPPVCGDAVVNDPSEECDDGLNNSDTLPDACRTDCTLPRCGDSVVDSGEGCDDGPSNSDTLPDACRTDCSLPRCGDGVVDAGEACEQTSDAACPGQCRSNCQCPCITMDAVVKIDGVPTDIGDVTACVEAPGDPPPPHTMRVDFEIDPDFIELCDEVEFHWFQIVVDDDCPPVSAASGTPAATPYADPPNGGYVDDPFDALPWYDEIGVDWCMCQDCSTVDTKSVCPDPPPWDIRFRTWLVAHAAGTTEFCLIAGFEWARTDAAAGDTIGPIDLGAPSTAHVFQANAALANADSGFAAWTADRRCELPPCVSEVLEAHPPGLSCPATARVTDAPGEVRNGFSMDIDGDTVIMGGALDIDRGAQTATGAAYVFVRSDGAWSEQAKLTAPDPLQFDFFGSTVAVDGDTTVVGSLIPEFDGQGNVLDMSGAAYIFVRNNGMWTQQGLPLIIPDPPAGQILAYLQVAIDADTAVVSALSLDRDDGALSFVSGPAYVFVRTGKVWRQQAELVPSAPSTVPLGISVAVDADTVVIGGAIVVDIEAQTVTGVAHVFVRNNGIWTEQAKFTACDVSPFSSMGPVAIDGDTIVIGHLEYEISEGGFAVPSSQSARIFVRTDQTWTEQPKFTLPTLDPTRFFPIAVTVAVHGDTIAVDQTVLEFDENGAPVSLTSSVSVLTRVGDVWTKQVELTNPAPLGSIVAVAGDTIAVGKVTAIVDANNQLISATGSVDIFDCLPLIFDLNFFAMLQQCMDGPGMAPTESCPDATSTDLDGDGDIDLRDFGLVQSRFTGPGP